MGVTLAEPCDTVFILGAGFSFDAGIPLMSGFVDQMWEFAIRRKGPDGKQLSDDDIKTFDDAAKVRFELNEFHGRAAFDDRNIEDILSLLSFGTFAPTPGRKNRLGTMTKAIARTIELTCGVKHPGFDFKTGRHTIIEEGPDLYRKFWWAFLALKAQGHRTPSIITFNYDLVLERSLLQCLVSLHYDAFEKRFPHPAIRIQHRYDLLTPSAYEISYAAFGHDHRKQGIIPKAVTGVPPNGTLDIEILKLHGSLNFPSRSRDRQLEPSNLAKAVDSPLILPPIFNKQSTAAQAGIWSAAMARLRSAKNVIIVGYSLPRTDIYMQYFLKAALGPNVDLNRIVVFDPAIYAQGGGESMRQRYEECFAPQLRPRIAFRPEKLGAGAVGDNSGTAAHFVHVLQNMPGTIVF